MIDINKETDVDDETKNAYKNALIGTKDVAKDIIKDEKNLNLGPAVPIPVSPVPMTGKLVKENKSVPSPGKPPAVCTDGASPDKYTEDKCDYIKPIEYSNNLTNKNTTEFETRDIEIPDGYVNINKEYNDILVKGKTDIDIKYPFTCKVATYGKGKVKQWKGGKITEEQKDRVFIEDYHLTDVKVVNKDGEIYVIGKTIEGKDFYQSAEFCYMPLHDMYMKPDISKYKNFIGKTVNIKVREGRLFENVKVNDIKIKENFILLEGLKDGKAYSKDITNCTLTESTMSTSSDNDDGTPPTTPTPPVLPTMRTRASSVSKTTSFSPSTPTSNISTDSPRPPKKSIGTTYQQTVTIDNIKDMIQKHGYTFIKIVSVEQDGNMSADFIKAYDGNGYIVYINLNGFGGNLLLNAAQSAEQMKLKAMTKTRIDTAIRNSASASKRDTVIVKGPEICIVTHKDDGDCKENFFTCIDKKPNTDIENGIEEDIPIQYPIISYFEIVQNLSGVMDLAKKFYEEQMKLIFDKTQTQLNKIIEDAKYLSFAINSFNDNRDLAFKSLKNERTTIASNFKQSLIDEPAKKIQARHACNMKERNEAFENYIKTTHTFNNYTTIIRDLTTKIVNLNNSIVDEHNKYHSKDLCKALK
jgi:hypothetical protein